MNKPLTNTEAALMGAIYGAFATCVVFAVIWMQTS